MKKFVYIISFLIFLIGIAWLIWTGFLREPEIEDVFTPAPQEIKEIDLTPHEGKG